MGVWVGVGVGVGVGVKLHNGLERVGAGHLGVCYE